jgi:hypothetical protein
MDTFAGVRPGDLPAFVIAEAARRLMSAVEVQHGPFEIGL